MHSAARAGDKPPERQLAIEYSNLSWPARGWFSEDGDVSFLPNSYLFTSYEN
jgi:hypothetical protein